MEQWLQNLHTNKPRFSKTSTSRAFQMKPNDMHTFAQDATRRAKKITEKEELIPVRLDVEIEGKRFKENLCWNVNEPFMTPEGFAKIVAEEHGLSPAFEHDIATYTTDPSAFTLLSVYSVHFEKQLQATSLM